MIWRSFGAALLIALLAVAAAAQRGCHKVEFDGAAARGQEFSQAVSDGLTFNLQALPAGWRVRVLVSGARGVHDAAEVATPPYQSASPLLLTTDYDFRAQDVVSWNPREFQFALEAPTASASSRSEDTLLDKAAGAAAKAAAEKRLVYVATHAAHGKLQILDAALVPGTADQSASAAAVASHWQTTPHTLVQPEKGKSATPFGEIESLKFRVTLWMPKSIPLSREWRGAALVSCPQ